MFKWFRKNKEEKIMQCNKKLNLAEEIIYRNIDIGIVKIEIDNVAKKLSFKDEDEWRTAESCGHYIGDHQDCDSDLINASEKKEETILTCPACARRQKVDPLTYFKCICCTEEITLDKESMQVLKDHTQCYTCNEKFIENKIHECKCAENISGKENKMKHPCGKAFDVNKLFKTEGKKISGRLLSNDLINIQGYTLVVALKIEDAEEVHEYMPCGHWDYKHGRSSLDLVNVPEEKEFNINKINLKVFDYNNQKTITVVNQHEEKFACGNLISFDKNGKIFLHEVVNPQFGFQLDEKGRIKFCE